LNKGMLFFIPALILGLLMTLSSCDDPYPLEATPYGEPDRRGSWSQIDQQIDRPYDWRQIVQDSEFQLGESVPDSSLGEMGSSGYDPYREMFGTYPRIDGSTVALPMALEFARQHLELSDVKSESFVRFQTTHNAYAELITGNPIEGSLYSSYPWRIKGDNKEFFLDPDHPVDIILATEPSDEELALARENNVALLKEPVCWDAFVFITHKDNPVKSLTVEQIRKIYTGEITNWKSSGGQDKEITAYQREKNSGSQTAMENLVMQGEQMAEPPMVIPVLEMSKMVEAIAEEYQNDSASIGYTYKYYIDELYKNENIKILQINGIEPSNENIRGKAYPFTVNYYGVIRDTDRDKTGGKFLDWILSQEGQRCVAQVGYIPLKD